MTAINSHTSHHPERVLATLNADGSRHWIKPKLSIGRFWHARRIVAYALIAIFTAIPFITINGKPAILLDLPHRRFTFFGTTFFPTDTLLLAVLMLIIFLTVFLVTALFGRVWCGWACPQTVYMEYLYRPIERLIDGAPGSRRESFVPRAIRKPLKFIIFFAASCYLAHTFLAYFVGVDQLWHWIGRSPLEHPSSFIIMAATTLLMLFDFAFFREQTCLVACPYGRLQSVMLDKHTMIVTYDEKRGEPRGKGRRAPIETPVALRVMPEMAATPATSNASLGDCVDCNLCVTTCPTGIDIRKGLQMECIGCAQCIDACDSVMDRLKRPRGLIRYSSRAIMEGTAEHLLRPRTILYPTILAGLLAVFAYLLVSKPIAEAAILPRQSTPFYTMQTGEIGNQVRLRLVNRGETSAPFTIAPVPDAAQRGVHVLLDANPVMLAPGESRTLGFVLAAPADAFSSRGQFLTSILITGPDRFEKELAFRMLGPVNRAAEPPPANSEGSK